MFVNKVILYDDYINIAYNISDNSDNNLKLENVENYFDIENKLNTKEEQSDRGLLFSGATSDKVSEPTTSPSWRRVCAVAS